MAKTLIGNVKGKDGRGIASIEKTGTTGSVDTYTIRYTDNTTSTYTVNNSDSISLQRQIVTSAAVESSATASHAYAAGDYVVVNGILRKAKSAIAKGNAISDSNSTATTVTGEFATLGNSVSYVVRDVAFSANQQMGSLYYGEFETEIEAKNFVLAFPLSGVRFIRPTDKQSSGKQRWMIAQTYAGSNESAKVMFCCF